MIAVLLSGTGGGVLLGAAVITRHRAQAVVDLAALAARPGCLPVPGTPAHSPSGWPCGITAVRSRAR